MMTKSTQVKKYLAYWFQLGKKIVIPQNNQAVIPQKIYHGDNYSNEFESLWMKINQNNNSQFCYLEGTEQTIEQLLSSEWEIVDCSRCQMPIPLPLLGIKNYSNSCVCDDLNNWPNNELPNPRSPINTQQNLTKIRKSLLEKQTN